MCDEQTEKDNDDYARRGGAINRRAFGAMGAAALFASAYPTSVLGEEAVTESDVDVTTPDGVSDSYFVHPSKGKHPGVLIWTDIRGLRPAFRAMGKRLAMSGYSVLVANPFYRDAKAPVVGPDASFQDPDTRALLIGMARKLNTDASMSDARAYIGFLDQQAASIRPASWHGRLLHGRAVDHAHRSGST